MSDRPDRSTLSARQKKILAFIESFITQHGYPPTIREIGQAVNINSTSVVNYNLNRLVDYGFIERAPDVSRGIRLIDAETPGPEMRVGTADPRSLLNVPLVGQIAASLPVPQMEDFGYYYDRDDLIEVPSGMIDGSATADLFALRVTGDSMIDAMVAEGDIVILRRQNVAHNGDMVAVWLSERGETTLKHYFSEGKRVRLQPANPTMDPIYVDAAQVNIQGRVLAVMRTLH